MTKTVSLGTGYCSTATYSAVFIF